ANPPYSIKSWDRKSFENDPYGRNLWGTPPRGCADYAFQQHIQKSLDQKNGRSITLWPHGILFREAEAKIRRKMLELDLVECVIGLGPNLFYNSPMEACLLITKTNKEEHKREKVLIINAVKEVKQEKNIAFLEEHHIQRIYQAYKNFTSEDGFSKVVDIEEILGHKASLNMPLYVSNVEADQEKISLDEASQNWEQASIELKESMSQLFENDNDDLLLPAHMRQAALDGCYDNTTQQIDIKNVDKTDWQTYRFDQIAKNITERVDPNTTDLELYIGLEHLDPESIHIKRHGGKDDVKGQKLKCFPGDVIFGKRRAYQRKAAVVTQEGFCSAHAMVLRANPDVIEAKLFPFFLHSDAFMHRAIDISVGSLSPTINWGTLKSQEFLLPPKDQQAQLAEL
ncbi:MAG: N-6 DNA methylase, partial [Deltaproteobacteria bacterium]|nr:N-6 DNA methylase [Deltaproteobacteria bacterium]